MEEQVRLIPDEAAVPLQSLTAVPVCLCILAEALSPQTPVPLPRTSVSTGTLQPSHV